MVGGPAAREAPRAVPSAPLPTALVRGLPWEGCLPPCCTEAVSICEAVGLNYALLRWACSRGRGDRAVGSVLFVYSVSYPKERLG